MRNQRTAEIKGESGIEYLCEFFSRKIIRISWAGIFIFFLSLLSLNAATPLNQYLQRVEEAAKLADDIADNDYGRDQELEILQRISELLPKTEAIARDSQGKDVIHVDNSWLHNAITKLDSVNESKRTLQLTEIAGRLKALETSLRESEKQALTPNADPSRERLQQILNREEYKPEEKKDSAIQAWLKKVRDKIIELLARLFGRKPSSPQMGGSSFGGFQIVVVIALIAVLVWALISLFRRFQFREPRLKEDDDPQEIREILGEQFDADLTPEDLLKNAAEFARKGEYRLAIRRAYLAALYELEQRGKLRLHYAKTNNDYLRELRQEPQLYPPIVSMTNNYERVWYGHTGATMEDYSGFIEKYREVAR